MTSRGLPDYSHPKPILRLLPDYSNSKMTLRLLQFLDDSQTAAHSKITPRLLPILRLLPDYSQTTPILRWLPDFSHSEMTPKLLPILWLLPNYSLFSDNSQITPSLLPDWTHFQTTYSKITPRMSSPSPKSKVPVPKSRPKGLGLTLKSHGPPTTPPLTFKHEGVL